MLVEVLSPGTEARDRFEKWRVYQKLASLRHHVLVSRDRPHLEVFDRQGEAWGGLRMPDWLDAALDLPALDLMLSLSNIYRRIIAA